MSQTGNAKTGGGGSPLSLFVWVVLAVTLAATAYLVGAGLAQHWLAGEPVASVAAEVTATASVPTLAASARLVPGEPAEGSLDSGEAEDEWRFYGYAGQSVTVETWFHPGAGSSVDAEIALKLFTPAEEQVAEESGSIFLTPYLFVPQLPTSDLYRLRVEPLSPAPGRYSLLLTLAAGGAPATPGAPPPPRPTPVEPEEFLVTVAQGQFQWPTPSRAISGWTFHDPRNPSHIGLDIAARMWDPITAAADGVVVFAGWGGGYGNLVIVEHADGWRSYYAHLSEIVVEVGQAVRQGALLGGAGTTGNSTGPHLHFELRYLGRPVDPQLYLP